MRFAQRLLVTAGLAVTLLCAGVAAARADVVSWDIIAETFGFVPNSLGPFEQTHGFLSGPPITPDNTIASVSLPIFSEDGSEQANGAAQALINPFDFNASSVGARAGVFTGSTVSTAALDCLCMSDTSLAGVGATLSNPLGGGATVDLTLHIEGSLILEKPAGDTGLFQICDPEDPSLCELVSDMQASINMFLIVGDLSDPFIAPLFAGTALLEWVPLLAPDDSVIPGSSAAALYTEGNFTNDMFVLNDGDDGPLGPGPCTSEFCRADIDLTLTFTDIQSLGFGEEFEVALLIVTDANQFSSPFRSAEADFLNSITVVDVTFTPTAVPAPGSLLLLGLGLLGMAAARRRRLH